MGVPARRRFTPATAAPPSHAAVTAASSSGLVAAAAARVPRPLAATGATTVEHRNGEAVTSRGGSADVVAGAACGTHISTSSVACTGGGGSGAPTAVTSVMPAAAIVAAVPSPDASAEKQLLDSVRVCVRVRATIICV